MSSDEYERLALEMLAVEAGDVVDVKDAMRKIIASAPEGADIAFLLSRALAHAGDRARASEPPLPLSWEPISAHSDPDYVPAGPNLTKGPSPSKWWAAAAVPLLGAAVVFGWLGNLALRAPDTGAQSAGATATPMIAASIALLGAALIGLETFFLVRWQTQSTLSPSPACPPGWYLDPWDQGASRWWDGSHWTGGLKGLTDRE